ncbi:MAG: hypothetical protein IIT82_05615, partial [Selenomonas sp.]|nr:hypothetical protein [Selenomonas sp.]
LCGRQAIDGDTAQVGPQVAEKLGLTQITYTEEIISLDKEAKKIVVKRHIDGGVETVEGPLPIVVTVNGSAAPCRVRNVKRVWANKNREFTTWGAADIEADPAQIACRRPAAFPLCAAAFNHGAGKSGKEATKLHEQMVWRQKIREKTHKSTASWRAYGLVCQ